MGKDSLLLRPIEWTGESIRIIDQTKLPQELLYLDLETVTELHEAICHLRVRGAPALGVAGALGVLLAVETGNWDNLDALTSKLEEVCQYLHSSRPTAVNLGWALDRMLGLVRSSPKESCSSMREMITEEALAIAREDEECNRLIGVHGSFLVREGYGVLTHCNAGILATSGYGTALSVLYRAVGEGKKIRVFVDETRPLLQGARLTAWELLQAGIDVTLMCDNAAGDAMKRGKIDMVIVGADRVAANGDTANKIGTYSVAVLASRHGIPVWIACPCSTIDLSLGSGKDIPIEMRSGEEVTSFAGARCAPSGVDTYNPAFDVTPYRYISGFVTEKGICRAPFRQTLPQVCSGLEGKEVVE